MKNICLLIFVLFFLVSCADMGKALRNEKTTTTDEFLVKKKGPLVFPPDYKKIPVPDTIIEKDENQEEKIKKILKAPVKEKKANTTSIEKSILEKIRK